MKKEPASIISVTTAFTTEVIGLLVAFNIDVTDAQRTAIIGTITAAAGVIALVGPIIRQFVYSPDTVDTMKQRGEVPTIDQEELANAVLDRVASAYENASHPPPDDDVAATLRRS